MVQAREVETVGFIRAVGRVTQAAATPGSGYRLLAHHDAYSQQELAHCHVRIFGGRKLGSMLARD